MEGQENGTTPRMRVRLEYGVHPSEIAAKDDAGQLGSCTIGHQKQTILLKNNAGCKMAIVPNEMIVSDSRRRY